MMKDNSRIYIMISMSRLHKKNLNPISQAHFALETLVEAAASFQDPEEAHDVASLSNPMQVEEVPEEQEQS